MSTLPAVDHGRPGATREWSVYRRPGVGGIVMANVYKSRAYERQGVQGTEEKCGGRSEFRGLSDGLGRTAPGGSIRVVECGQKRHVGYQALSFKRQPAVYKRLTQLEWL